MLPQGHVKADWLSPSWVRESVLLLHGCWVRAFHKNRWNELKKKSKQAGGSMESSHVEYVGFWARFGASIVDTLIILAITFPILYAASGAAFW
jgi:hypothetical protein